VLREQIERIVSLEFPRRRSGEVVDIPSRTGAIVDLRDLGVARIAPDSPYGVSCYRRQEPDSLRWTADLDGERGPGAIITVPEPIASVSVGLRLDENIPVATWLK
jgi:hypothetical protein